MKLRTIDRGGFAFISVMTFFSFNTSNNIKNMGEANKLAYASIIILHLIFSMAVNEQTINEQAKEILVGRSFLRSYVKLPTDRFLVNRSTKFNNLQLYYYIKRICLLI